jgi:hypothetical protein
MMREDLLLYHRFLLPNIFCALYKYALVSLHEHCPLLANSCFHYKWAFAGHHYVCERDQKEKHDRITGSGSSSTMARDGKTEKRGYQRKASMHNGPSVNDAWKCVQQAHTKVHVLAQDVQAYRTQSQDLLRVGQHQVGTTGLKRVPRNFPFINICKKNNVSRRVGSFP